MPSPLEVPSCLEQIRTFAAQPKDSNYDLLGSIEPISSMNILPREERARRLGARMYQLPLADRQVLGMTTANVGIPPTQEGAGDDLGLLLSSPYDALKDDFFPEVSAISLTLYRGHRSEGETIGGSRVNFLDPDLAMVDLQINLLEQVMDVAEKYAPHLLAK